MKRVFAIDRYAKYSNANYMPTLVLVAPDSSAASQAIDAILGMWTRTPLVALLWVFLTGPWVEAC